MPQLEVKSPLLKSLEELGALSSNFGLIDIKPFKDWLSSSSWKDKLFTYRLLNAGETLEVLDKCQKHQGEAKGQALTLAILARAIYQIDKRDVVTQTELQEYAESTGEQLSKAEYLERWLNNLEQVVIERLEWVYSSLKIKQGRKLNAQSQCEVCGRVYNADTVPKESKPIKNSINEIVCGNCFTSVNLHLEDFDFVEAIELPKPEISVEPVVSKSANYTCDCLEEFSDFENFIGHKQNCPAAQAALRDKASE